MRQDWFSIHIRFFFIKFEADEWNSPKKKKKELFDYSFYHRTLRFIENFIYFRTFIYLNLIQIQLLFHSMVKVVCSYRPKVFLLRPLGFGNVRANVFEKRIWRKNFNCIINILSHRVINTVNIFKYTYLWTGHLNGILEDYPCYNFVTAWKYMILGTLYL